MSCRPAEGDGTKQYASCLAFYDELPAELCAAYAELVGARALKCLCLLSHHAYPTTFLQVRLYSLCCSCT